MKALTRTTRPLAIHLAHLICCEYLNQGMGIEHLTAKAIEFLRAEQPDNAAMKSAASFLHDSDGKELA